MPEVAFDRDHYNLCLCGGCPVNGSSACVQEHEKAGAANFKMIEETGVMPPPEEEEGIYCSRGKSACGDLSGEKSCLCPACPVQISESLQNNYYCMKGSAEEVG